MLVYQTGIQIYDQISITRIWSKVKLHHAGFAKVCLKGGENTSQHHDIWHALLSAKWSSKSTIKF